MVGAIVHVRYFAGARSAAGLPEEKIVAASLEELVAALASRGPALARVLSVSSFLVDGTVCRSATAALPDGATVDVLPPFAGG